MSKLREEIEEIRDGEFAITAKLLDLFKSWGLEMVGEDEREDGIRTTDYGRGYLFAKKGIRQRIKESTK